MRNLLRTDFVRMLTSKGFYIVMISLTAITGLIIFTDSAEGEAPGLAIGSALCSVSVLLFPVFICGAVMLFVSAEFTGGAIRNKLIVGHRRSNVYLSWNVTGIAEGTIISAVAIGLGSLLIALFGDTTGLVAKNVIIAAVIILFLLFSKIVMSILIAMLVPGAKGLMFNYILTYALLILFMIAEESYPDSKVFSMLARCFPEGQVMHINLAAIPDRPWLTVLCSLCFSAICLVLGVCVFRKKDLT